MIRPTTIPHTLEDLLIEQAIAREALALAFSHHKTLAVDCGEFSGSGPLAKLFNRAAARRVWWI